MQDVTQIRFWREAGRWCCAVPRNDTATRCGFDWKRYGLIGRGATRKEALDDWENWQKAADFVADIY